MPSEPDHKIDAWLKAYARQRREQAGEFPEMHEVTRRELQAQVARHYGKARREPQTWRSRFGLFWPRLGFALGLLVVLGLVLIGLLQPQSPPEQMARSTSSTSPADLSPAEKENPASAPQPARGDLARSELPKKGSSSPLPAEEAPLPSFGMSEVDARLAEPTPPTELGPAPEPKDKMMVSAAKVVSKPALETSPPKENLDRMAQARVLESRPSAEPTAKGFEMEQPVAQVTTLAVASTLSAADSNRPIAKGRSLSDQPARPRPQAAPAATDTESAPAPGRRIEPATMPTARGMASAPLSFRRTGAEEVAGRELFAGSAPDIMVRFELEQIAQGIRIHDADGSVYEGNWLPSEETQKEAIQLEKRFDFKRKSDAVSAKAVSSTTLKSEAATEGDPGASSPATFRVSGTNRTLAEKVSFTGALQYVLTNAPANRLGSDKLADGPKIWVLNGILEVEGKPSWRIRAGQEVP